VVQYVSIKIEKTDCGRGTVVTKDRETHTGRITEVYHADTGQLMFVNVLLNKATDEGLPQKISVRKFYPGNIHHIQYMKGKNHMD